MHEIVRCLTATFCLASSNSNSVSPDKKHFYDNLREYITQNSQDIRLLQDLRTLITAIQNNKNIPGDRMYPQPLPECLNQKLLRKFQDDLHTICTHRNHYFGDPNTKTQFTGINYTNTARLLIKYIDEIIAKTKSELFTLTQSSSANNSKVADTKSQKSTSTFTPSPIKTSTNNSLNHTLETSNFLTTAEKIINLIDKNPLTAMNIINN